LLPFPLRAISFYRREGYGWIWVMSALAQKCGAIARARFTPNATAKADIPWWIGEANVQGKLVGPSAPA
jgi:hypothetical protein